MHHVPFYNILKKPGIAGKTKDLPMLKNDESIHLFFLLNTTKPVLEWILILKYIQHRYAADAFTIHHIYFFSG
jgi:hypothetical protein